MPEVSQFSRVEARQVPGCGKQSLYGREWETCGNSEGIDATDAREFIDSCKADERRSYGAPVSEYRFIDGLHINHEAWLAEESAQGRQLDAAEFIAIADARAVGA